MKKVLLLIFCLLLITGCDDEADDNVYKIELNEPYNICGEEIYFSNDSFNDELDIERIIEEIKEDCNVDGMQEAKRKIKSILNGNDYTKEEILWHLEDAYDMMKK